MGFDKYDGDFIKDKFEGKGTWIFDEKSKGDPRYCLYQGQFKDGMRQGLGSTSCISKEKLGDNESFSELREEMCEKHGTRIEDYVEYRIGRYDKNIFTGLSIFSDYEGTSWRGGYTHVLTEVSAGYLDDQVNGPVLLHVMEHQPGEDPNAKIWEQKAILRYKQGKQHGEQHMMSTNDMYHILKLQAIYKNGTLTQDWMQDVKDEKTFDQRWALVEEQYDEVIADHDKKLNFSETERFFDGRDTSKEELPYDPHKGEDLVQLGDED